MSYSDELSVKLTAKDEMSARLKGVKKELEDTTRAMAKARAEFQDTGSPEALAELKRLEKQHQDLAKAYRESSAAARKARDDYKAAADGTAKATTVMGRLGQTIEKHAKRIQQAGVVAAAAMALFARSSIKGYAEAEKSQIMLEQAYSRFPKLADVNIAAMRGLNTELMNLTGADDDALASAEALLARFDLTGSQIMQLMPLINDYAIATGQDLPAATSTIGKAMLGNAKALKSLGINYKATGDRAQDYANIMAILEAQVGGVGKAFGESTAGKLEIANQNFENLKEEVGAGLVPALKFLVDILRPVVGFLTGLPRPLQQAGFFVAALGIAAMIATPRIIALKAAMNQAGMNAGMLVGKVRGAASFLAGPLGIAFGIATLAVTDYMNQQDAAQAKVDSLTEAMRRQATEGLRPVAEELVNMFTSWSSGQGTFQEQIDALGLTTKEFVDAVLTGPEAADELRNQLYGLQAQGGKTAGMAQGLIWILNETSGAFGDAKDKAAAVEGAMKALGFETEDAGDKAEQAASQISALSRAVNRMNRLLNRGLALKDFGKAADAFAKKKSKENARDFISNWNTAYSSFKDGSEAQARFVNRNYAAMKRAIRNSGVKQSIKAQMIDELNNARTAAQQVIDKLKQLDGMSISVSIRNKLASMGDPGFATGGLVTGPGSGTSDSISARLSNGEYVLRAAAVQALGVDTLDRLNHADRVPALPPIVNAPSITLPSAPVGRDAPLVGSMTVVAQQQVDVDLALMRLHRQQQRDARTRTAGTR